MIRDFCTYFDHRYLAKGLALYRSLEEHAGDFRLFVLCLTPECHEAMRRLQLERAVPLPLDELEAFDAGLLAVKPNRSAVEYYFTSTPAVLRYLFARFDEIELLTYLDADLAFFSSPEPLFQELEGHTIGIVAHRFPEKLRHLEVYGRFNVAWVSFRREGEAFECLERWRQQCLDWCHDRAEDGRFADQKYLDDWPERYRGVKVLDHPGADLAPWNVESHALSMGRGGVLVDGRPLVFHHAHQFDLEPGGGYEAHLEEYRTPASEVLTKGVLEPYRRRLEQATTELAASAAAEPPGGGGAARLATVEAGTIRPTLLISLRAAVRQGERAFVRYERALAECERDRAARLDVIERQVELLRASEADRASRLAVIEAQQRLLGERDEELCRLEAVRRRLSADLESARTGLEAVGRDLERMRASRSWRLTGPLRWLAGLRRRRGDGAANWTAP